MREEKRKEVKRIEAEERGNDGARQSDGDRVVVKTYITTDTWEKVKTGQEQKKIS